MAMLQTASPGEVVYTVLEVLIALACCLGNALVVWAVRTTAARQETTFCFVASLAAADFLVGALGVPMSVLVDKRVEISYEWCLVASCVVMLFPHSSVLALLAIATDRFLRVRIPLRYRSLVTHRRSWWAVAACWLLAGMFTVTSVLWSSGLSASFNSTKKVCEFVDVVSPAYLVYFSFLSCTAVPLLAMMVLYGCVFLIITRHLRQGSEDAGRPQSFYRKERSLGKSLALVLVLFVICWLPLHIMNCLSFFVSQDAVPKEVVYVGIILTHAHSAINPIVYAFRIHKIRAAYMQLLGRCFPHFGEENSRTS